MSNSNTSLVKGLKCRECGNTYDKAPIHVCEFCFGPLEVDYDYAAIGKMLTRAKIESRPHTMWRYAELLPIDGPPVGRPGDRHDAAGARRPAGQAAGPQGGLGQERRRQPPVAVVQGSRRVGRGVEGDRVRHRHHRVRVDGQPGQRDRGAGGRRRAAGRHPDPVRPRGREGAGHQHLRRARGRRQRHVRRRQPAVLGDRGQVRLGVRQREPAPVLRRGLEELRATRSPSSSAGGCPRTSSCRWRADRW